MTTYEKINTLWKRDMEGKFGKKGKVIDGDFSLNEFALFDHWEVSEKIDGTNIRIVISKPNIDDPNWLMPWFGGRTDKAVIPEPLHTNLKEFFIEERIKLAIDATKFDDKVILYCEGYGAKIQKGGKYLPDKQDVILYDVMIDGVWLEGEVVTEIAERLGIKRVPIITEIWTKDEIIKFIKSKPKSLISDEANMEGVVCRSKPLLLRRNGERLIFKLKVIDYE